MKKLTSAEILERFQGTKPLTLSEWAKKLFDLAFELDADAFPYVSVPVAAETILHTDRKRGYELAERFPSTRDICGTRCIRIDEAKSYVPARRGPKPKEKLTA